MMPTLPPVLLLATLALGCTTPATTPDRPHTTPLDWTLGEWTGTRTEPCGPSHPIRVRVSPILGGAGQLREMWVDHDGGTYRGMSIQLREAETGAWTRYYANDVRGRLVTLKGVGEVGGDVGVWRSDPGETGRCSENRSERLGDDGWRSTVSRTTDGGDTWSVVFVDELNRTR